MIKVFANQLIKTHNTAQMTQHQVSELSDWGLLLVEGSDAGSFLQGQLTNSILGMTRTPPAAIAQNYSGVRLSGYCTAKGRLLGSAWICLSTDAEQDRFALFVSRDLAATFAKRLAMFVLRSKAKVVDVSHTWTVYGVLGPANTTPANLPSDAIALTMTQPSGADDQERILFATQTPLPSQSTSSQYLAAWNAAEIASAIPRIVLATQDQFVPQMINLESIGGVDFKKGCYPGQEVVARSQYRGAIKRRLYLAQVETALVHAGPATEIIHESDPGQPAGMVVLSAQHPSDAGLVTLQIECKSELAQSGKLHLGKADGPPLVLGNLPYSLIEI
jgi:folate-binding protein YgfZ